LADELVQSHGSESSRERRAFGLPFTCSLGEEVAHGRSMLRP